jgi:hypothetical protein
MREVKGMMLRNTSGRVGAEVARRSRNLEDNLFTFFVFSNYSTYVFNVLFTFAFCFVFLFSILYILCFCVVLCCFGVWILLLCCLFAIFVQVYQPFPTSGNPIAVNKYRITSYDCRNREYTSALSVLKSTNVKENISYTITNTVLGLYSISIFMPTFNKLIATT